MKYRKKPVVIEAFRWGKNRNEWPGWMNEYAHEGRRVNIVTTQSDQYVEIPTLEGVMKAGDGDWIIRGVKGEIYPCKNDIFEATYEAV